eukprot:TRINITY_DN31161_c0_g1_i1.p1 TRINITY_DN31161_c0_g1~~TRINITY_DN31161_c0_g1_i1.p1  ORF type:complete len:572 (-),score=77.42 TRINITY_DN31161_c0_g1_i1:44-1759(-)
MQSRSGANRGSAKLFLTLCWAVLEQYVASSQSTGTLQNQAEEQRPLLRLCLANYEVTHEPVNAEFVGPATDEDATFFGLQIADNNASSNSQPNVTCPLAGLETDKPANNRHCSHICGLVDGQQSCRLKGFLVDVIMGMAKAGNFDFVLDAMPFEAVSGKPSLMQTVLAALKPSGPCDLWVSPLTMTAARSKDLDFSMPIVDYHVSLVRKPPTKTNSVESDPIIEGWQVYTTKIFSPWVWAALFGLYCLSRLLVFCAEKVSAPEDQRWARVPVLPFPVPHLLLLVCFGVHRSTRKTSLAVVSIGSVITIIVIILYEAKVTEVLLSEKTTGPQAFQKMEDCGISGTCCYSVQLFRDMLVHAAGTAYANTMKYIEGGDAEMFKLLSDGTCRAAVTSDLSYFSATKRDRQLCSTAQLVPQDQAGLAFDLAYIPKHSAFAVRRGFGQGTDILLKANIGMSKMYSGRHGGTLSFQEIFSSHFAPNADCAAQMMQSLAEEEDRPISLMQLLLPLVSVASFMILIFCFAQCCNVKEFTASPSLCDSFSTEEECDEGDNASSECHQYHNLNAHSSPRPWP